MTTLYFEAAEEDDLRKCGFSKDGKHSCPQIFPGLLVASSGNPIGYEIYEGNISEGHTMIPLIRKRDNWQDPMFFAMPAVYFFLIVNSTFCIPRL